MPNVELGNVPPSEAIEVYRALALASTLEFRRLGGSRDRGWALHRIAQAIFEKLPVEMQDELVAEDEAKEARRREEY